MASLSPQRNVPQCSDARGLLIPDDIIKNQDYIKLNPDAFWVSYQFYIRVGPTHFEVMKYLSAIPDRYFCLIKSLCLDFGFSGGDSEFQYFNFPIDGKHLEQFEWLVGKILDQAPKVVLKILWGDDSTKNNFRPLNFQYSEGWEYRDVSFNGFWSGIKNRLESKGYDKYRIEIIRIRKWNYNIEEMQERAREIRSQVRDISTENSKEQGQMSRDIISDEISDKSDETRTLDNMSVGTLDELADDHESDPTEEYENKIFKIDPHSKDYVCKELWHEATDAPWVRDKFDLDMFLLWDPVRGHY